MRKILFLALAAAMLAVSCQDNKAEKASRLLDEARDALNSGSIDKARGLIDSIRSTYPEAVEVRYKALDLSNELNIQEAANELSLTDSLLAAKQMDLEEMKASFKLEKNTKYQSVGYYVTPEQTSDASHKTMLRAEVNEEGQMLLVSIVHGRKLNHKKVMAVLQTGESVESAECFSFLTHSVGGYEEESSYKLGEDGGIVKFIVDNPGTIGVRYIGDATLEQHLTPTEKHAVKSCYALSLLFKDIKELKVKKEKLEVKKRFYERKQLEDAGGGA